MESLHDHVSVAVIWDFLSINSSAKSAMPSPFSEVLRWRDISMKEMLGYQVDEVVAALNLGQVKANIIGRLMNGWPRTRAWNF